MFLTGELYKKEMELAAIWLERPVHTATERKSRIASGDLLKVESGRIVDCLDKKPTHKVIACYGTVTSSSLTFALVNLSTNQPTELKLK